MVPATTDKTERRYSPGGRKLLGSKGIGRFASARLGNKLKLVTTALVRNGVEGMQTTAIEEIDWTVFDSVEFLQDVSFEFEVTDSSGPSGTHLTITELRDAWTRENLEILHKELKRLISPLDEEEDGGFKIFLDLSACTNEACGFYGPDIVSGAHASALGPNERHRVRPFPLLKSCDYEIYGEFSSAGSFSGTMTIHRGELLPAPIAFSVPLHERRGERSCGTVLVHLFIFDREAAALREAMSRAGMGRLSAKEARQLLDQISGVSIYRDRFRIRPYGDSDNDWLTLDSRRVQNPTLRIGHNQVSGLVLIDDEDASGLIERSSREGLEENGSFLRLQSLILELFAREVEPRRRSFRVNAGIDRVSAPRFKEAYTASQMHWAQALIDRLPADQRESANALVQHQSGILTRRLNALEERQAALEQKVTLGLIIGEVIHEGQPPVNYIYDYSRRLYTWWPTLFSKTPESEERLQRVPSILKNTYENANRLSNLFQAIRPLAGARRGKPAFYNPNQVIIDAIELHRARIEKIGVKTTHQDHTGSKDILGYKADLATAITNLMDNSLYWLEFNQVGHPTISVEVSQQKENCVIHFRDNGRPIKEEFRERIFDVGFTLKSDGTGLGLSIAREALSRSNATISFLANEPSGVGFELTLPYGG